MPRSIIVIIIIERTHERQMRTGRLTKSSRDQLVSAIIPNRYYCYYLHSIASSTHVRRCRSRCLFSSSLAPSPITATTTTLVSQSCLHRSISKLKNRASFQRRHAVTIDTCPSYSPVCFFSAYFLACHRSASCISSAHDYSLNYSSSQACQSRESNFVQSSSLPFL